MSVLLMKGNEIRWDEGNNVVGYRRAGGGLHYSTINICLCLFILIIRHKLAGNGVKEWEMLSVMMLLQLNLLT